MRKNGDAAHGIVGVVVRKWRPGDEKRFAIANGVRQV